ncbi:MAG: F0F1 ATP synthase subunit delta [Clostridiales bacterium]|jgi:F0F1-type ATP synthase delta subunit|nr:F0F1 ATP synthase subunit delta [Clostridiales bacterium]
MKAITVISGAPLSTARKEQIETVFRRKHEGTDPEFVYDVDSGIIGGIMIIDDGVYYDGSLRSQLEKMRQRLQ